jgi:hypothetical protein
MCFQAAAGIANFARAHAANFVGSRPATLLASAMASRESALNQLLTFTLPRFSGRRRFQRPGKHVAKRLGP